VVAEIECQDFDTDECLQVLLKRFPNERPESLRSILAQSVQRRVKKSNAYNTSEPARKDIYDEYNERVKQDRPGVIVGIAKRNRFSPALTAKLVLEEWLLERYGGEAASKDLVRKFTRNTCLIEDGRLAEEVFLAGIKDDSYGFVSEAIKDSIGKEYEQRIRNRLRELNIGFQEEQYFRNKGYDKTPDFKLQVPVAVSGHIVNWIESKALFGEDDNHKTYVRDQFHSYSNRFGPGLVIYW
jgi:hypothetical protein